MSVDILTIITNSFVSLIEWLLGDEAQWLACPTFACPLPDLRLTVDHFVGRLAAIGHSSRPTQPSIPPRLVSDTMYYLDYGDGDR